MFIVKGNFTVQQIDIKGCKTIKRRVKFYTIDDNSAPFITISPCFCSLRRRAIKIVANLHLKIRFESKQPSLCFAQIIPAAKITGFDFLR